MSSNDPLFGIIVFVGILGMATLIDYVRSQYRERKKTQSLNELTKSYEFVGLTNGVEEFLALSHNPIPTLQFIANAYTQSGNTQEAIKIYLSILENLNTHPFSESSKYKIEILQSLGIAYHSAGFLQRAKNIFLETLKNYPRNPQVLIYLLKTYESLGDYKNAISALECVEEIYDSQNQTPKERFFETLSLNKSYLETLLTINDYHTPLASKITHLQKIKDDVPRLEKFILTFFKSVSLSLFWEEISKSENISSMIDILWSCEYKEVPFARIYNQQILDVYRAKGWIENGQSCTIFELENMRILRKHTKLNVNLDFEYRCHSCKNIFPFENARCSHCGELLQSDLLCKIREGVDEAHYPIL